MNERPFTEASFVQFLKEKKLMGSKCKKCGALWLPPRPICIKCHSDELEWVELKGKGKLVAFTVIPYGSMLMILDGYGRDNPYCSGIVELDEGPRISAQILGVDIAHPENIKIGTPLTVDFTERGTWHSIEDAYKVRKTYVVFKAQ